MELIQRIMITRPAHQAGNLADDIEAAGGTTFLFPTLEIQPAKLSAEEKQIIEQIQKIDIIIFIEKSEI